MLRRLTVPRIIFLLCFCAFIFGSHQSLAQDLTQPESVEESAVTEAPSEEAEPTATPASTPRTQDPDKMSARVFFNEKTAFRIFYTSDDEKQQALDRASKASRALDKALKSSIPLTPKAPLIEINNLGKILEVRVRGYRIVELTEADRAAAGYRSLDEYRDELLGDLRTFVVEELDRLKIQRKALQFFLSVFFALMGFVVFRQVRLAFNRADMILEQKRESFQPIVVLSETLVSEQALGGLFATILAIGRVFAYLVVVLTTLGAILGQFQIGRNLMSAFFRQSFEQTVETFQSLLEAIPGFLLAIVLLLCLHLLLKILDLYLKGVRSGRISWKFLVAYRIPVVQFWGTVVLCVIFFPLVVAAVFGRFHTPIEVIVLIGSAVVILSTLPILVSIAAGSFILWQRTLEKGQWIEVSGKKGEIADVSLHKVVVVPEEGGRIHIPMLHLLLKPSTESKCAPFKEYRFSIKRTLSLNESLEKLNSLFANELEVRIACSSLSSEEFQFSLFSSDYREQTKAKILEILSRAHEEQVIQLGSEFIREVDL